MRLLPVDCRRNHGNSTDIPLKGHNLERHPYRKDTLLATSIVNSYNAPSEQRTPL